MKRHFVTGFAPAITLGAYHDVGRLQKESGASTASPSTAATSADGIDLSQPQQYSGWRVCFSILADHERH